MTIYHVSLFAQLFEYMNIYMLNILRYLLVISSANSSSPRIELLRASTSVDQYA